MSLASGKGPDAFRTISEASSELGVPAHVLRFWETKFSFVRPMKRAGGRRFYRPQDLDLLRGVRTLLQEDGYTIKGVQRLHKEGGVRRLAAAAGVRGEAAEALAREVGRTGPDDLVESEDGAPEAAAALWTPAARTEVSPTDLLSAASAPPDTPDPVPVRHVLDAAARARLTEVLGDLERVKGAIDALLAPSPPRT